MSTRSIHQFSEKVALVTDGTNPIGIAVALQLALNGAYVIVGVPNDGTASVAELESLGTLASSVGWRTDESGAIALIDAVRERFGRLDLLVNCVKHDSENETDPAIKSVVDVHFSSVCYVMEAATGLMRERPKPRIVTVVAADDGDRQDPVFAATQAGLIGFTKALSADLPKHFRVNAVSVSRKMAAASGFDPDLIRPQPAVATDDVARAVLFLLSGESTSINGETIALA